MYGYTYVDVYMYIYICTSESVHIHMSIRPKQWLLQVVSPGEGNLWKGYTWQGLRRGWCRVKHQAYKAHVRLPLVTAVVVTALD